MVELRWNPGRCAMADLTSLRNSLLRVVRIIGVLVILQVARYARLDGQIEVSIRVALVALQSGVRPV